MCISKGFKSEVALNDSANNTVTTRQHRSKSARRTVDDDDDHESRHHVVVHHSYRDYADTPDPVTMGLHQRLTRRRGASKPFPLKLYDMLSQVEQDGVAHIVSWQPHGRCFVIHKPKDFKNLLQTYFGLSKLTSYQRQLNLYGFVRLTRGTDRGGYYNELFLRGKRFLANEIPRVKVKGTGVRGKSNPEQEPDLWSMKWLPAGGAENCDEERVAPSRSLPCVEKESDEDSCGEESQSTSSAPKQAMQTRDDDMSPLPVPKPLAKAPWLRFIENQGQQQQQQQLGLDICAPPLQTQHGQPDATVSQPAQHKTIWGMPFHYIESYNESATVEYQSFMPCSSTHHDIAPVGGCVSDNCMLADECLSALEEQDVANVEHVAV